MFILEPLAEIEGQLNQQYVPHWMTENGEPGQDRHKAIRQAHRYKPPNTK
jgi:hypothetical protein